VKARVWKRDGAWEYDVQWDGPPRMRATGTRATWQGAIDSVFGELAAHRLYLAGAP
jgi:hypothetical protein